MGHNGMAHLRSHGQSPLSRVVALCDKNPDRLQQAAAETGVTRLYRDPEELAADPEVDAVSISTGDNDHVRPLVAAVAHGKHVLVEKPLANSEDDVLTMAAAVRRAPEHLKIQVGYILRFNPVFEEVHRLCRADRLGRIYYLEGDYIHNLLYQKNQWDPVTGTNWYLQEERPMVGGGSHPLDLLRWFSGREIVRVFGASNHVAFPEMHHDDCQVCLYQFDDGTLAKVAALYAPRCAMAPYYNLRIYGTAGTVERDTAALGNGPDDVHPAFEPVTDRSVQGHPFLPEIEDWLTAILEDRPPRIPFWDGANSTMATLCACRAMESGSTVEVPVLAP